MKRNKIAIFVFVIFSLSGGYQLHAETFSAHESMEELDAKTIADKFRMAKNDFDNGLYEMCMEDALQIIRGSNDTQIRQKAFEIYDKAKERIKTSYSDIRNWSGPRIGVTGMIDEHTRNTLLANKVKVPVFSAFGWQFEWRFITGRPDEKMAGLVVFVPMLIGIEQALPIISANLVIGLRFSSEFEIGFGPNITILPVAPYFQPAVTLVFGNNFKTDKLNFPLNLALVVGKEINLDSYIIRAALIFGFNTVNQ